MKLYFRLSLILLFTLIIIKGTKASEAQTKKQEEKFNLVEFAFHHISDSYSWDFYTRADGSKAGFGLPRILWNKADKSLHIYLTTKNALNDGWIEENEYNSEANEGSLLPVLAREQLEDLKLQLNNEKDSAQKKKLNATIVEVISKYKPLDFSITKNVLFIFIIMGLMCWIFISIANRYKKDPNVAPKGLQSALEPIIVFIRDDIAKENISHNYERYLPLLLNFFFFIWFLNMMGLVPFSANVTGNITVTASLAIITLLVTTFSGNKSYWHHILWFPGVPVFIKPIMFIVEFIGVFTKPFALTIRLFANMIAGHMVIISFICLIFIFGELGRLPAMGFATSVISVAFSLFIYCIELFIALLQAYIFTMLSALFIGQAVETEH